MFEIIDREHAEIYKGHAFFYNQVTSLASEATGNWVFETSDKKIDFAFKVNSDTAGFSFITYEGITSDNDGTPITPLNYKRDSANPTTVVLQYNPSNIVTTSAINLRAETVGTSTNPAKSSAGTIGFSAKIELLRYTKYILRITNLYAGVNPANIFMSWDEKENEA